MKERPPLVKKPTWFIRLGPIEWARYTYERPEGDALKLLGSIKRGPQMGALAITQEGQYVQLVGDFITPLNTSQITRAMAKATAREPEPLFEPRPPVRTGPPPVVTIKKRRTFVGPT